VPSLTRRPAGDNTLQFAKLEWLCQDRSLEGNEGFLDFALANDVTGDEDDMLRDTRLMHVDPLEEVESAFVAKPDVDECAVDFVGGQNFTSFVAGGGSIHDVAAACEPGLQGATNCFFIIHIQNSGQISSQLTASLPGEMKAQLGVSQQANSTRNKN
jgi:hypothetical protein